MRGQDEQQATMLLGLAPDDFVPADHPIRSIRAVVDAVLREVSPQFDAMYARTGRPSVPPEHLVKASLLMALYSIPSERQFCERLRYDLLFKWFLGLPINEPPFDPTSFTKNRQRLLEQDVAVAVLSGVVEEARRRKLLSEDHFSVDGTLMEAWASLKSVQPKDGDDEPPRGQGGGRNREVDFHGQRRSNATHASTTDPEAKLMRKGNNQAARLCYAGHVLVENRNGFIVDALLTEATGYAEREAAVELLERQGIAAGATLGADKSYDTRDFVAALDERGISPHIARHTTNRRSAVPEAVAVEPGYALSQRRRKLAEEPFGWLKTVAQSRKLRYLGVALNNLWFTFAATAYNLVRLAKLRPRYA